MREMLALLHFLLKRFRKIVALITDGRFSGGTRGLCIGHICPEAAQGDFWRMLKKVIKLR